LTSFGVILTQDRPVPEVLDWARRFEEAGVDSLWIADHLASPVDPNSRWYEGWTLLACIAERTTCRIGPLVSNFVLHPPLALARLTTTLDAISNGRLDLGLGMGGTPVCRSASGVFDDGPALFERFETGVECLIRILENQPLPLAEVPRIGTRATAPEPILFSTPCIQAPRPPIVIGGQGPRIIDLAARVADCWNIYLPPGIRTAGDLDEALRRLVDRFEERCAAHGRQGTVEKSILLDNAPGLQPVERQELADLIARLSALGFDHCVAESWPADYGLTDRRTETLLEFVGEDLPALKASL
jgi:alkanesulfonate monooxygenase SsuD/methylene tetrahydromethanopterin reductase-like flavin-dependent oxidoreductase (luciferase family)